MNFHIRRINFLVNPLQMLKTAPIALLIGIFMMFFARPTAVYATLLPFRSINLRSKAFVSWVGLKGASPIIFATYPILHGIEGGEIIFNIVFFITLMSLIIQGSTLPMTAKILKVNDETPLPKKEFDVDLPETAGDLTESTLTEEMIRQMQEGSGVQLKDQNLPEGMRVLMIKRDGKFIIPTGNTELCAGDHLLIINGVAE